MDDTSQLILTELREFRAAVTEWQQETGERVSALEVQVKSGITGNGQPSRLQTVERTVDSLSRFKYWLLGAAAAISAVVHFVLPGGKH
jgi:hypothetical protein